jgi:DNA-binding CsgD family transcriptional regulator
LRVSEGESWFDKALTDSIMTARNYSLTRREGQLVTLLTQGLKNKEIATQMKITEGTVKVYMSRLLRKLEVKDRFELALYGLKNLAPASDVCALAAAARPFLVERMPAGSDRAPERKLSRLPC